MTGERDGRIHLLSFTTLFPNPSEPARGIFVRHRLAGVAAHADLTMIAPVNAGRNPRVLRTPRRRRDPAGFDVLHPRFAVLPGMLKGWDASLLFGETFAQIHRAVRARPVDLVDAHYAYPDGAAAARLARRLHVPYVLTVRGSDLEVLARNGSRRAPIIRAVRGAAAIVAVSDSLARKALDLGADPGRVHVVPNGIDASRFRPSSRTEARRALGLPQDARIVLAVGRLDPVKGHDLLIASIATLRARRADGARAWIVGDGPLRPALSRSIASLGLEDVVTLHGGVLPEELPEWYAACDLVCLLSTSEGCPNVVREALACGRPVVATEVGGVRDLIQDGRHGVLVLRRDPEEVARCLADALDRAWDPAAIAASVRGRSWDAVALEQMAVYRAALEAGSAP